ncbi:MAG: MBL fold metallo-hydrolase [Anaerolineae bacterium]|nr:MBL fold metallo-hydrolase [Anaerolineae bacterium]
MKKLVMARPLLGHALYHTAAYWVDGLLIDSGCAFTARELLRATASLPLERIVNTHCHEDHIGGNGLLQRRRGVRILAHPLALPILANPRLQYLQLYRRLFWGWPEPSEAQAVGDWIETEHYRFQVIPTPGHSPDHVALFEPGEGWLFPGDAFIGGQDRTARPDYDVYAIIDSLKRMAALEPAWLFPGSGTVRERPAAEMRRKVAYLEDLAAKVRHLHEQGLPVRAIQRRLLGREPHIRWLTLGHFRGEHLVRACLGGPQGGAA